MDGLSISPDDRMEDLLNRLPGARRALFAAFHIGGCQSCSYRDEETLAEVCDRNELTVAEAIHELEASHERDQEMLITAPKLKERIEAGNEVRLLDIRTREEHQAVTLPSSEFLTQELQNEIFAQESSGTLVLFDHLGRDVLDRCAWFRGHGLKNTLALQGGIDAWSQEVDRSLQRYRLEMD